MGGLVAHAKVYFHLLASHRVNTLYVPYPGIFVVFLLQLVPKSRRPDSILLDGFISIYDTLVFDRKLLRKGHFLARLLRAVECRSFDLASRVITDTEENAAYYSRLFSVPIEKFTPLPLSTNEVDYQIKPTRPSSEFVESRENGPRQVLFVGTLVPLHGIDVILKAAHILQKEKIRFRLIGDGQQRQIVKAQVKTLPNVTWVHEWIGPRLLNKEIHAADICLGIFGNSAKAERVCPLKIYSYACCGSAIVTAASPCMKGLNERDSEPWLAMVPANDPAALSAEIVRLLRSPQERFMYEQKSASFYRKYLSNRVAEKKLFDIVDMSFGPRL
jgi:glycosyltransferase involved in cell wall biosynthesis